MDKIKEFELIRELRNLKKMRGSGTELISLYIPPSYPIAEIMNKLRDELGQASNIKSKTTRVNVQAAIEKIIQYLKLFKNVPKNGIAIFCGNLSKKPGVQDIQLFSMEPPTPLNIQLYRCDSVFFLEPLEDMLRIRESYIMLVIDGKEATIGILRGKHIEVKRRISSLAPPKTHKGGSSAARYQRIIEERVEDYYKRVGEAINEIYLQNQNEIKGIIVGGPGPSKEDFLKEKLLHYQLKVLGVYDVSYTDETGLNELLDKTFDIFKEQEAIKEREVMQRFMSEIAKKGKAVYGAKDVEKALNEGKVEVLLISEDFDIFKVTYRCKKCGEEFEEFEEDGNRKEFHDCGGELQILKEEDAMDLFIEKALKSGSEIEIISTQSQEGKELFFGFGQVGALLRY
ncbi:MAG: peptide chain release factor aRF-1 [Candidatus Micrarchaeales archaeon]